VLLIIVLLAIGSLLVLGFLVSSFFGQFRAFDGGDGDLTGLGGPCPFLSSADARSVLGGQAEATVLAGFLDFGIGIVADRRALTNEEDCWVNEGADGSWARVARYVGGNAQARYAAERAAANPTSEPQGGGVSIETEGWIGRDLQGVGDEGFCTSVDFGGQTGALIRYGNRLVFASIQPGEFDNTEWKLDPTSGNLVDERLCNLAVQLASKVSG
jgi:hypothetical protein